MPGRSIRPPTARSWGAGDRRIECRCPICDPTFWRYKSDVTLLKGGIVYCSKECRNIGRLGSGNPKWRGGGVSVICKQCGSVFRAYEHELAREGRGTFCSRNCKSLSQETLVGPLNHRWTEPIPCARCGTLFKVEIGTREKYCSKQCAGRARAKYSSPEERMEAGHRRRRLNKSAAPGWHSRAQWLDLLERYKHRCANCKKRIKLTRDHIIPISRGGSDDITNIQPLCQPCNSRKQAKRTLLL
jgi:5-methylcytosine-specific restriction endonuclease McrA